MSIEVVPTARGRRYFDVRFARSWPIGEVEAKARIVEDGGYYERFAIVPLGLLKPAEAAYTRPTRDRFHVTRLACFRWVAIGGDPRAEDGAPTSTD